MFFFICKNLTEIKRNLGVCRECMAPLGVGDIFYDIQWKKLSKNHFLAGGGASFAPPDPPLIYHSLVHFGFF